MSAVRWGVVATLLAATSLGAQSPRLDSLRAAEAGAARRAGAIAAERERAAHWAESQYREIAAARRQEGKALQQALRGAQSAADSLARLDRLLGDALTGAGVARERLAIALQAELERTVAAAERARPAEKAALTAQAQALARELQQTRQPLVLPPTNLPAVVIEPTDGPTEIGLKADFLADRAAQLRSAADVLAGEIAQERRRAELQDEVQRLVAETQLFGDAEPPPPSVRISGLGPTTKPRPVDTPVPVDKAGAAPPPERATAPAASETGTAPADASSRTDPVSTADPHTRAERLARLRAELLRRSAALERQSTEVRALLRQRP